MVIVMVATMVAPTIMIIIEVAADIILSHVNIATNSSTTNTNTTMTTTTTTITISIVILVL